MFAPYWVSFPEFVRLCGAAPRVVATEIGSGWKPTAAALDRAATPRTRGVIVNSPSNPSGAVIEEDELLRILDWCDARDAVLIFDETYDHFLYGGRRPVSAAALAAGHPGRAALTGSAPQTAALTGWRLGWALACAETV